MKLVSLVQSEVVIFYYNKNEVARFES